MAGPMSRVSGVLMMGPLAAFADAYRAELYRRGYTVRSAVCELRQVARFSRWLEAGGLGKLTCVFMVKVEVIVPRMCMQSFAAQPQLLASPLGGMIVGMLNLLMKSAWVFPWTDVLPPNTSSWWVSPSPSMAGIGERSTSSASVSCGHRGSGRG